MFDLFFPIRPFSPLDGHNVDFDSLPKIFAFRGQREPQGESSCCPMQRHFHLRSQARGGSRLRRNGTLGLPGAAAAACPGRPPASPCFAMLRQDLRGPLGGLWALGWPNAEKPIMPTTLRRRNGDDGFRMSAEMTFLPGNEPHQSKSFVEPCLSAVCAAQPRRCPQTLSHAC